jgi:hypothetical protein
MSTENVPAREPSDDELREPMMYPWRPRTDDERRYSAMIVEDRLGHPAYWTAERIIAALQRWARKHGRPPSAEDWRRALGSERYLTGRWRPRSRPSTTRVADVFGSWTEGLRRAGLLGPRLCASCGETFTAKRVTHRFCSKTCWNRADRAASLGEIAPRDCGFCGESFTPKRYRTTRFCSKSCADTLRRSS